MGIAASTSPPGVVDLPSFCFAGFIVGRAFNPSHGFALYILVPAHNASIAQSCFMLFRARRQAEPVPPGLLQLSADVPTIKPMSHISEWLEPFGL